MNSGTLQSNHLSHEKSPYLLQHSHNPVNWYPWCTEAFIRAKAEDKPIFLSIGYSTCHWCHVMAHESFEDEETASYLNKNFIAIKVDKEERPDIDSIYMAVCQAFTGSGGWPTSIFMTPDQKPFFAGTYFPVKARYGMNSFMDILKAIQINWKNNKSRLIQSGAQIVAALQKDTNSNNMSVDSTRLSEDAEQWFRHNFDEANGGFGQAPKFPTPHNLWFLLSRYQMTEDKHLLNMVEKTLIQMYRGGIFDHIGYGFSRYSTDDIYLAPHFEKMLYDNALLILVYCKTFELTGNAIYKDIAVKTANYVLRELTDTEGGFYCAQDADAEGEEGKYYLFTPEEIELLLGEQKGRLFNQHYDITQKGNFEGLNIPNLLKNDSYNNEYADSKDVIYEYRKQRYKLHLDDKILTSWNGLMIAALCTLYQVSSETKYLEAAIKAYNFIKVNLCENNILFVSYRNGRSATRGFLDDYANIIFAVLCLYDATLDIKYYDQANIFCQKAIADYWDDSNGGFYLYSNNHEELIVRPKDTYDGAIPSGNSIMAYNLVRLCLMNNDTKITHIKDKQLNYMSLQSLNSSANHTMFLIALLADEQPPEKIVVVLKSGEYERLKREIPLKKSLDSIVILLQGENNEYQLINNETTYYVCKGHSCLPPKNTM